MGTLGLDTSPKVRLTKTNQSPSFRTLRCELRTFMHATSKFFHLFTAIGLTTTLNASQHYCLPLLRRGQLKAR